MQMTLMPHNTTIEKMQSQKYTWPNCSLQFVEDYKLFRFFIYTIRWLTNFQDFLFFYYF